MRRPSQHDIDKFQALFKISIFQFCHPILGFDVIEFNHQVIKTPDGISMRTYIESNFSNEAAEFVAELIQR